MKLIYYIIYIFLFSSLLYSCNKKEKEIIQLVTQWRNKQIILPNKMVFTKSGTDTINYKFNHTKHKILVYVDSIGCTSCKLRLDKWKDFINHMDSISNNSVSYLFFFHANDKKDIIPILKKEKFKIPICIDKQDELYKLNKFPYNTMFQTFLLDKNNKVIAIGNPIHNLKVKELYIKIITGKQQVSNKNRTKTSVETEKALIEMGELDWQKPHDAVFTIKNIGNNLLVVDDIDTTCGCTSANYAKKPVGKGENLDITVTIKPKNKGYFEETITVYCNAKNSPIQLKIKGNAI